MSKGITGKKKNQSVQKPDPLPPAGKLGRPWGGGGAQGGGDGWVVGGTFFIFFSLHCFSASNATQLFLFSIATLFFAFYFLVTVFTQLPLIYYFAISIFSLVFFYCFMIRISLAVFFFFFFSFLLFIVS